MQLISFVMVFGFPIAIIILVVVKRSKYQNKSLAGPFFIEDDRLVINTLIPKPILFSDIDYVELHYNSWELEHKFSYELIMRVIKKDGKIQRAFYKGYKTTSQDPISNMEEVLTDNGLKCVMVNSQKKKVGVNNE